MEIAGPGPKMIPRWPLDDWSNKKTFFKQQAQQPTRQQTPAQCLRCACQPREAAAGGVPTPTLREPGMHLPGPTGDAIRGPVVQGLRHGTRAGHCHGKRCVDEEAGPRTAAYSQRQVNMTTPAGIMMEAARYACVAQLGLERLLTHSVLMDDLANQQRLQQEACVTGKQIGLC